MKDNEKNQVENPETAGNEVQPQETQTVPKAPEKKKRSLIKCLIWLLILAGIAFGVTKIVKHCQEKRAYECYDEYDEDEPDDDIIAYKNNIMNIVNPLTQEVIVKDIDWYRGYESRKDTIVLFAKNGKRGYCNVVTNKVIVEPTTYTKAWIFSEGLAAVEKDGYIGFVNADGKVAINFRFPYRGNSLYEFVFHDGHCVVADSTNKIGVIDTKGRWVIQPLYDEIELAKEYAIAYKDGDFKKQIDYQGNILQEGIIDNINNLYYDVTYTDLTTGEPEVGSMKNNNFYEYRVGGNSGLISSSGKFITRPIYKDITGLSPTLFVATLQDWYSTVIIDEHGNVVSAFEKR